MRHCWHPVAEAVDIGADAPLSVTLLGNDLVLWRSPSSDIVAAPDRCPHREAPLSLGWVDDGVISCPYHGWAFGDGGRCVRVPSAAPGTAIPPAAHLPCVNVREQYGLVWVCLGEPRTDIPEIPQETDSRFRRINSGVQRWNASATRLTDNFMDISHFPWVHTGTFGDRQRTEVPTLELQDLGAGWYGYQFEVDARNVDDEARLISGSEEEVVHRHMSTGFTLPLTVRSTIRYEDGL